MRIREADIETDRDALVEFLRANLSGHGGAAHYDWLYRRNPHGVARAWIELDEDSGKLIGAAAAFPRRMRVRGRPVECWNLGDFAIDKEFRSLGPALRLQRACLQEVLEDRVPFAYDHPSCNMLAIYRRLGIETTGQVTRFAKLLRLDDKIKILPKGSVASRGVVALGNLLLSIPDRRSADRGAYEARLLEGRFDERFADLEEQVCGELQVTGCRSVEYLNWKYVDNPLNRYETLELLEGGELRGYAVLLGGEQEAVLVDLFGRQEAAVIDALLAGVIETARRQGVHTLSAPVLEQSPLVPALKRWGFVARESSPLVVTTRPGGAWDGVVTNPGNWYLNHGDRDV